MGRVVVCLPDMPERRHMGDFPANVDVVLAAPEDGPMPDLAAMDLVVPDRCASATAARHAGNGRTAAGHPDAERRGRLAHRARPEGVMVCNARGVFDVPLAEWVVGAILAMQRGLVRARDAQAKPCGPRSNPTSWPGGGS